MVAPWRFESGAPEVFAATVPPGRRFPEHIAENANLPEKSFVPPDEVPLVVPGSPSAGGRATGFLSPPELGRSCRPVRFTGRARTDSRAARFGPTTPKRARRLADASVDPTEAA
jgi:hypothetical protein